MQQSREQYRELGLEVLCGVAAMHEGALGLYLGDPEAAESGLGAKRRPARAPGAGGASGRMAFDSRRRVVRGRRRGGRSNRGACRRR